MNVHPPLGINLGMMSHALLGGGSIPSWVVNPTNPPDLAVDFSNNRAWTKATKAQTKSASLLTVSRASSGTVNDSLGNWTQVASNLPRLSDLGLLVEEARTNAIRNNSMAGAVVMADGVELLTNGTFTPAGGAGWNTTITGTGAIDFSTPGVVKITGDGGTLTTYIWQQLNNLIPGRSYVVSVGPSTASILVSVGATQGAQNILGRSQVNGNATNNPTPDRVAFTAPANGTVFVNFERSTASQGSLFPVSIQDGERVENGGFTSNPINASQNTVQNGWQWFNTAGTGTVVLSGNTVQITGDGTHGASLGSMALPTVAGFTYTITVDITGNTCNVQAGTTALSASLLSVSSAVGTGQKFQFTATTSTTFISFAKTSAVTATIANVSVQSAGALPTNWIGASNSNSLIWNVVALGTESGIPYMDFRVYGTTSGVGSGVAYLLAEGNLQAAATYGQTWFASQFCYISAGSTANITPGTLAFGMVANNSGGSGLTAPVNTITATSGPLGSNRALAVGTFSNSATAFVNHRVIQMSYASGVPIDITLRVGWPQMENNSAINSTVASAATAASGASGVNGSAVYSVGGGTGTAATLNVTWAAGVMTVNSVASAGSYTVFPPSPAALTYVSGTATGWTGATVNLTPTNNAASAFATSPIVTTSSAATRAADVVTMPATFGSAYTMFGAATPQAPVGYTSNQVFLQIDDGTTANRDIIFRSNTTGAGTDVIQSGAVQQGGPTAHSAIAQNASTTLAASLTTGSAVFTENGDTVTLGAPASAPVGVNRVAFGTTGSGSFLNGFMSKAAIWQTQAIPNAQLQSMTT